MKINIEELNERKKLNFSVFSFVAKYLNDYPCFITGDMLKEITSGDKSLEQMGFAAALASAMTDDDNLSDRLAYEYFEESVRELDYNYYINNDYYKNIKIPNAKIGTWELGTQKYEAYEGFIRDDITVKNDYTEIPAIGYFSRELSFPTVFENGVEWMAIKPNEIETMKEPISKTRGDVAVFGLGIGYFAYMASQRDTVLSVTVIERDDRVIQLFEKYILPQFPNKDKIKIVKSDAFEFVKDKMKEMEFDCAFVDLWHDVSDGVELYIRMKKLECIHKDTEFMYWIEKSILSSVRWRVFDAIYEKYKKGENAPDINECLTDSYLRNFVKYL